MAQQHSPTLNMMIKAAEKAGRVLSRDFGEVENLQVSKKGPGDFVTAADIRSEQIIYEMLSEARPDYGFLMEESGRKEGKGADKDKIFIIDPIDGTTNFMHALPFWCISIGLQEEGELTAGVIYNPILDEMFIAEKGQGAFLRRQRLRVSGRNEIGKLLIATAAIPLFEKTGPEKLELIQKVLKEPIALRNTGSTALNLAYLAAGRIDACFTNTIQPWDMAAGIVIVREAGGLVESLDPRKPDPLNALSILATNGHAHDTIKSILQGKKSDFDRQKS